jgi:DNA repair exonuclease SbcCD ATPase subunit
MDLNMVREKQTSPFEFLLYHREGILNAVKDYPLKQAYSILCDMFPGFDSVIPANTFKAHRNVLNIIDRELKKKDAEIEQLKTELKQVREKSPKLDDVREKSPKIDDAEGLKAEIKQLKTELKQVREKSPKLNEPMPDSFMGWTVQLHPARGYYQMWKYIAGKTRWIHIGRQWNSEKMKAKIEKTESEIDK